MGPALAQSYAQNDLTLGCQPDGDATLSDGGQFLRSRQSNGGLSGALDKLHGRNRSNRTYHDRNSAASRRNRSTLGTLTDTDNQFYNGESSEAAEYGQREIGGLGQAQSYGRLRFL